MATRRRTTLTQRERECRRAAREKAARLLLAGFWRSIRVYVFALVLAAGSGALAWGCWTGALSRTAERTTEGFWRMTADAGFAVQTMYLEGRSRTQFSAVKAALGVKKGAPILSLPLEDIRARLEALPTVKHASVERQLPDRLYIRLVERQPVAVWQHGGQLSLIDDEGAAMDDLRLQDYQGLPLLIGADAPRHVTEALALLGAHPELTKYVADMVWISDRRWNVQFAGGLEVKLPADDAAGAWDRFARMQHDHALPDHAVRAVDMRAPDRIYIRMVTTGREA